MQKQLGHYEFKQIQRQNSNEIIFVLDNLEHEENIGSAFRLADSFNIEKIIIINSKSLDLKKIQKTARNCEQSVKYSIYQSEEEGLKEIQQLGYTPVNIEITSTSKPLRELETLSLERIALIVGNEKHGVSEKFLQEVPLSYHIEMYGNNSSMNVSTSLAIATYKISEDLLKLKDRELKIEVDNLFC